MDVKTEIPLLNAEKLRIGAVRWSPRVPLKMTIMGGVPERFETIVYGGFDHADAVISFEVRQDWDFCTTSITFNAPKDNPSPRAFDFSLQGISLDKWLDYSLEALAHATNVDKEVVVKLYRDTFEGKVPLISEKTGGSLKRPRMTNERLMRVAAIYNSSSDRGLQAVQEDFQVSKPTAARYVKQAREHGLIEDRRRNKTSSKSLEGRI